MRLHALQYLRAVAALAVVYSHTVIQVESYAPLLLEFGGFGVDIFFVISGFIMVFISKPTDTPRAFIINRVRRVVPLYWFFTLAMACILLFLPMLFKRSVFDWQAFALSLAFIPYESIAYPGQLWPIVAPGWSLNYEMYFYVLFALSLFFAPRLRVPIVIGLLIVIVVIAKASASDSAVALFYGHDVVFEFVFGMALAVAWRRGFRIPPGLAIALVVVGMALLLVRLPTLRALAFGLPALMVVTGALYIKLPENRLGVLLGDASYSLYLCHLFVLGVLRVILPPLLGEGPVAAWSFVAISLVVCIIASIVVHVVIDNWLLRIERLERFKRPEEDTLTARERRA